MKRTKQDEGEDRAVGTPSDGGVSKKRATRPAAAKKPPADAGGPSLADSQSDSQSDAVVLLDPQSEPTALPFSAASADAPLLRGSELRGSETVALAARGPGPVDLVACQERIGHTFRDESILLAALTHASGAAHRLASNERLEFLGDAILGFIVCDTLYRIFPHSLEGDLTRIKSVVVSRETCGRISEHLGLTEFLIVGKGLAVNSAVPVSVLSDLFESVVAAIYLDGGIEPARLFVSRWMDPEIAQVSSGAQGANHKSLLQQLSQRDFGVTPTYEVMEESGPDHSKSFHVSAFIGERRYTPAWGRNKKEAEQRAASNALGELRAAGVGIADAGRRG
jgi:ribonuclease-3